MTPSGQLRITHGTETTITRVPLRDAYLTEAEEFSRAVETGGPFEASGEDGTRGVAITVAILEAARAGRIVQPAEPNV